MGIKKVTEKRSLISKKKKEEKENIPNMRAIEMEIAMWLCQP